MARSVDELVVGAGTMYVAAEGTSFPTNPSTAPSGSWADIGYSDDGWTVEADKTFEDINVAETLDPIATYKTAQAIRLTGIAKQASLTNIELAFAGGTVAVGSPSTGFTTYTPPSTDSFNEKALLLRTRAPNNIAYLRDWRFPRAVAAGAISLPHTKAPSVAQIAFEWRILKPTSGDIFTIIDQTA